MIDMANSFREEKVKSTKCLLKALEENADSKRMEIRFPVSRVSDGPLTKNQEHRFSVSRPSALLRQVVARGR